MGSYLLRSPPPKAESMLAKEVFHDDAKYQQWCNMLVAAAAACPDQPWATMLVNYKEPLDYETKEEEKQITIEAFARARGPGKEEAEGQQVAKTTGAGSGSCFEQARQSLNTGSGPPQSHEDLVKYYMELAKKEAKERTRKEATEKAKKEAEERVRKEAKEEAQERIRNEAEEKAKEEAKERIRKEAEEKAKEEAKERIRKEAEEKAKEEAKERISKEVEG
ncbi:unnamed protein product [Effrenium voratum]|nr:unnamed protein product [Effrenium voratum]